MSRPRGRRGALAVATILTAAFALAGCSSGMIAQTGDSLSGAPGAFGDIGSVSVRDVVLDAGPSQVIAPGGEVGVSGTITNQGGTPDRLVSATTPYAQEVVPEGATTIPAEGAVRLLGSEPGPVAPPTEFTSATMRLTLTGVTQAMRPGPTYPITLTFERAGAVTIPAIVTSGTVGPAAG